MAGSDERSVRLHAIARRGALLAFGWWALTGGDPAGFAFGLPLVAGATLASIAESGPSALKLRPRACAALVGLLLGGSVRGAWDVACRALSPRLLLSPSVTRYATRLDSEAGRLIFTSLVTLMPGTLVVDIIGRDVWVHTLVKKGDELSAALFDLESRVALALGLPAVSPERNDG